MVGVNLGFSNASRTKNSRQCQNRLRNLEMIALKEVDDVTISNEQYRVKSYKLLKKFLLLDFANETFHDKK